MKILMATSHYYPTSGGSERQAHQLARALIARGHDVRVLTMRLRGEAGQAVIEGVPVHRAIIGIERGVLFGISYLLTAAAALIRLRRFADILHAHHVYLDAVAAGTVGSRLQIPALAKVASGGVGGDLSRLRRLRGSSTFLRLVRRLNRVVAVSRQTEAEMREAGFNADQVVRIPNGVDIVRFRPPHEPLADGGPVCVYLGRLAAEKGVNVLLNAWSMIAPSVPRATLVVAGDGVEAARLRTQAEAACLSARVRFVGVVSEPEALLRTATAFVLPSWHEGLPNALLEAMATGLPCVATSVGGVQDVATDGCEALLVPPGDAHAIATALRRVLTNPGLAAHLGDRARRRVMDHFSLDRMVMRYERLYQEMRDAT